MRINNLITSFNLIVSSKFKEQLDKNEDKSLILKSVGFRFKFDNSGTIRSLSQNQGGILNSYGNGFYYIYDISRQELEFMLEAFNNPDCKIISNYYIIIDNETPTI